jgi:alkanesulfonate monooxygenase SsuD/methylene tetrahydromethanopterin reductase-like flavin-dependent oxidoreductase (luciferase family)
MEEQARVCQLLWKEAPASFHGKYVNFDKIYCTPFPAQAGGIPIWFGLAPTERNFGRIGELGYGWIPMETDPAALAGHIKNLRGAFAARGRDPKDAHVRAMAPMVFGAGGAIDMDATLAAAREQIKVGVDTVEFVPLALCAGPHEVETVFERILTLKD